MIALTQVDGQLKCELDTDELWIGRAERCDMRLEAADISARHASIVFVGDGYMVRDHHSLHGTRIVRGKDTLDVSAATGRELPLESGDILVVGPADTEVCFQVALVEPEDGGRVVSMRRRDEIAEVERSVDRELLQRLVAAQKEIGTSLRIDDVLTAVANNVFGLMSRATHVTVALAEEQGKSRKPRFVPVGTRVRGEADPSAPVPITRSIFRKVFETQAAVLAADAKRDVGETESLMAAQILSTIGVPLWGAVGGGDSKMIGVLQVDNRASQGIFKPADLDLLAVFAESASQAFERARLFEQLKLAEEKATSRSQYLQERERSERGAKIIGDSSSMKKLFEHVRKVMNTPVTVLVHGETGTGKELIASALHDWSNRSHQMFVAQNCAAMPENLLESELFGHKKGAFTGATNDKKGLFALADGGTLFLDEIGEMPLSLQAKLLRVLQEGEFRPLGSNRTETADVRVVAATNRDLEKEVREGRFREDLFYRLGVFPLHVPALRERREDIPALAEYFLTKYASDFGRTLHGLAQETKELLQAYDWPGNVRELENEVQRMVIQTDESEVVPPDALAPRIRRAESMMIRAKPAKGTLKEMMEQIEKSILADALRDHDGNKSATAKTLGITREGLHKKLKSYGMT